MNEPKKARKKTPAVAYLLKADNTDLIKITSRWNKFKLEELQKLVGGYIERVEVEWTGKRADLIVNEEGQLLNLAANVCASIVANRPIVGDAVLLRKGAW